jgi:hypothetical protein
MLEHLTEFARAQVAGPDVFMELWKIAQTGTPLIVMLMLAAIYYMNSERKAVQARHDALFERYVEYAKTTSDALRDIRDMFSSVSASRRNRQRPDE